MAEHKNGFEQIKISDRLNEVVENSIKNAIRDKRKNKSKKILYTGIPLTAAILASVMFFTGVFWTKDSINVYAENLMQEIKPQQVKNVKLSNEFINATADFSMDLFKHSYKKGENSLISPTSIYLSLGMTANGASDNTLKQFQTVLGKDSINIDDLNSYYNSFTNKLTDIKEGKLDIANSIWYRDNEHLKIEKNFLQTNGDYFNASAYKEDFDNPNTIKKINNWVKNNTGNQIDKIINNIDEINIMYLINAIYFEDKWEKPYGSKDVSKNNFELIDGTKKSVDFMLSEEEMYLDDDKAEGFIKPYQNGKYSFVGILPNKGTKIDDYISNLTGNSFIQFINSEKKLPVHVLIPKFKTEYKVSLAEPLEQMGLKDCFDAKKANFSKMGSYDGNNLYIGEVLHKTSITVSEQDTKAGAATVVDMRDGGVSRSITLNRPFLYSIIDNETKLPIFIGVMMKPEN